MTVADFNILSIGFVVEFCLERLNSDTNKKSDEEKYLKFKEILPLVEERHEDGEISESEYTDFIKKYQSLEGQYGWDY